MATKNFALAPTLSISRSKFNRNYTHKFTAKIGELIPLGEPIEVLPGDTHVIDFGSLVRMSNPIAPIMDDVWMDVYSFFVPNRLVFADWKKFMGENTSGAGIISGPETTAPQIDIFSPGYPNSLVGGIGDYFGLPIVTADNTKHCYVSTFPVRGYRLIYNRFFRDQNLIAPVTVYNAASSSVYDNYGVAPFKVAKVADYFTTCLPYAQKHAPVTIPMGTSAPVVGIWNDSLHDYTVTGAYVGAGKNTSLLKYGQTYDLKLNTSNSASGELANSAVIADLSQATAATINELRFAFQLQKLYEKDSMFGSRYWEILKAHFSVNSPDSSLQDPELLGHKRINISIDEVTQTTGIDQATPANNKLGQVAAKSVTGGTGHLCTKSFTEHGLIINLCCFRHKQSYSQGVSCSWTRKYRTDYYFPVFANLGNKKVLKKELFVTGASTDDDVFGYQEAWSEYRFARNTVSGLLRPNVSNSLGYWTLANNFASMPTLGQSFIEQGNANLARALSTGSTGPDFICDFAFKDVAVRPMPVYSIPGLIDHH